MDQTVLSVKLARFALTGSYTVLVYEYLLVLDREYRTIYKSRWSPTKFVYLACRFTPILAGPLMLYLHLTDHDIGTCRHFIVIASILALLITTFPHCIYILRAWAFTGAKRLSLLIYLPCLFAYLFVVAWHSLYLAKLPTELFQKLGRTGCFKVYPKVEIMDYARWLLVAAIMLDGVVGLTVAIHCLRIQGPHTRLSKLLVTQGLIYFPLMFSLNIWSLIIGSVSAFRGYAAVVFATTFALSIIMACRFVIQIREYASTEQNTNEILERVQRDVELAFPSDPPSSGPTTSESLELSNIKKKTFT